MLFIASLFMVVATPTFGQSKKELKDEIIRLKHEIGRLKSENARLKGQKENVDKENKKIATENARLKAETERMRRDSTSMQVSYQLLRDDYKALLAKQQSSGGSSNSGSGSGGANVNDPKGGDKCAQYAGLLQAGHTYTLDYKDERKKGWGIQVYSFSDLCKAKMKATEFRSYFKLHPTYLRVKDVRGKRVYTVVCGMFKTKSQAQTYCTNFRKIAKDKAGKSAFVISHGK